MATIELPRAQYLTVDECAALLRVSHKTVRGLIRRRELPAIRVGQQLRISADELDRRLRAEENRP